jgi:hypothetical protein
MATALTPTDATRRNWMMTGSALAFAAAGVFAGLAIWGRARRRNPIEYTSSTKYLGVPIHFSSQDGKACADYRALDRYAPGAGKVICAASQADAERQAKRAIDAVFKTGAIPAPAQRTRRAPTYPSPWD